MAKHATKITPQKIHSVLKRAGHTKAEWIRVSRGLGWAHWTTGYTVQTAGAGVAIQIHQMFRNWGQDLPSRPHLERYQAALQAAGIASEIAGDILIVPVEQPEPEG